MPKVVINLVTWNSLTYLPYCLNSIFDQEYKDFYLLIIDNGSTDGSIDFIQKNYPQVKVLRNTHNLGYSRAHNQGILLTKSEYILILNHDTILTNNFLKLLVEKMDSNANIGSIGGKILKFHFKPGELREIEYTDIIDSTGLIAFKNRRFKNRGENEIDRGQYDKEEEVFGISGAIALFRRDSLEDIKYEDEYFDQDFFMYKEDNDLAWRLKLRNWKSLYVPKAIAYHHREAAGEIDQDTIAIIKSRRSKSKFINFHSYRNHLLTIIKNELSSNLFWWFPLIFYYEFKKLIYIILFERSTARAIVSLFRKLPNILKKRQFILNNLKVDRGEIRQWFK